MTTRNLNTTWRDIVFKQYAADFEADVPFPVCYLINIPVVYGLPGRDIWIEIRTKIDLGTLRNAILAFVRATRDVGDPTYQDDHISVRPRLPNNAAQPDTIQDDCNDEEAGAGTDAGGDTAGHADSKCESTSPAPDHKSGTGNIDCSENTASHRSFEFSNMGNCILYLYSDVATCENDDSDFEQVYDLGDEDECIPPDFNWNGYKVDDC